MVKKLLKNSTQIFLLKQKNILSAALVLMVLFFASSFLGLIRNRLLAGAFFSGQERLLDVYFAAFRLPDMIYQILILGGLSAAFIPVFSDLMEENKNKADQTASTAINLGMIVFIILALLVFILARPLCNLIAPGFNEAESSLMVKLTRLLLLAQSFFFLSSFLTGILQSYERFLLPAVSAILYNLGIIAGIVFLAKKFSIYGVVYGVIIGAFLHFIIQVPLVYKLDFRYQFLFDWKNKGLIKIVRLMLPRLFSLIVIQINLSVATIIASSLSAGALALYTFAQNIIALPVSLFGLAIGQASLPALSKVALKSPDKFRKLFLKAFSQVLYLSLPASIVLIVLRIPVVRLVLGAKNFPWEATILTGKLVAVLAVSITWQSLTQLLIRYFYAKQDTTTPLTVNIISALIGIVMAFWFVFGLGWGIVGLSAAMALSAFLQGIVLLLLTKKQSGRWLYHQQVVYLVKIIGINLILGLVLWFLMRGFDLLLDTTKTINLIVLTILTMLVSFTLYIYLSWRFSIKEIEALYGVIKRFGRWRQIFSHSDEILDNPPAYD